MRELQIVRWVIDAAPELQKLLFPELPSVSIDKRVEVEQEIVLLSESKIWVRFPHPDVQWQAELGSQKAIWSLS